MGVIPGLQSFCFFTHTAPNEPGGHPAAYLQVSPGEMNNGNHPVVRIAEAKIRDTVADGARLFAISSRSQNYDRHMSISCGMFVAVDIEKANRITISGWKRTMRNGTGNKQCSRQWQKKLKCTHPHK